MIIIITDVFILSDILNLVLRLVLLLNFCGVSFILCLIQNIHVLGVFVLTLSILTIITTLTTRTQVALNGILTFNKTLVGICN
jgi:hypothetical protein